MIKKLNPTMDWIVYDDNEILKKECKDVEFPLNDEDWEAISKMVSYIDCCYDDNHSKFMIRAGIGITANQIGYSKKIIYVHFDEDEIEHKYLIANPKIIEESSTISYIASGEGCLSVEKNHNGITPRKNKILVKAYDILNQKEISIRASGLLSICLQHEIDHSNGFLYYDKINKINPYFKKDDWIKK